MQSFSLFPLWQARSRPCVGNELDAELQHGVGRNRRGSCGAVAEGPRYVDLPYVTDMHVLHGGGEAGGETADLEVGNAGDTVSCFIVVCRVEDITVGIRRRREKLPCIAHAHRVGIERTTGAFACCLHIDDDIIGLRR